LNEDETADFTDVADEFREVMGGRWMKKLRAALTGEVWGKRRRRRAGTGRAIESEFVARRPFFKDGRHVATHMAGFANVGGRMPPLRDRLCQDVGEGVGAPGR
jgi:hypothetical protein